MRRRAGRSRALLGALLAASALAPGAAEAQTPPPPQREPAAATMARSAERGLAGLAVHDGTERSRARLLTFNLSRYFTAYPVADEMAEVGRLVGTADRIARAFVAAVYQEAGRAAAEGGQAVVGRAHVGAALETALPARVSEAGDRIFFPRLPEVRRVAVEEIDLEALRDTGFGWNALAWLATEGLGEETGPPPIAEDAAELLARGAEAYGLLLFRLGGEIARAEYADAVATRHLRAAAREIALRSAGGAEALAAAPAVPASPLPFADATAASGVRFRHVTSDWLSRFRRYGPPAPTFSGGGAAAVDLDGDGWDDLVVCGGRGCALFRGLGGGRFEERTARAGIASPGEARMALAADFDGDGRRDLFVTYARDGSRLFANRGGLRFEDATEASGLARPGEISGPATTFDCDGDGDLDLYVGNFGDYLAGELPWVGRDARNGLPNRLFVNTGGLRFEEAPPEAAAGGRGWTQALSHVDFDGDGDQDVYVANDFGRNDLLVNDGRCRFASGGAAAGADDPFHGMNAAFADLNGDKRPDVYVTNIWSWDPIAGAPKETNSLLLSRAGGAGAGFERRASPADPALDTGWSWAGALFDYDLDGDDDLFLANGLTDYATFLQYRPHPERPDRLVPTSNGREPNWLLRNDGGLPETPVSPHGAELADRNTRAVALADFDRDGDLDLAVTTFHSEARIFRNDAPPAGSRWLAVELVGEPARGAGREAIGAVVTATGSDALYVWRAVTGGGGYLAMDSLPLEFGLGAAERADLEIVWPGGRRQVLKNVPADRFVRVVQR